MAIKSVSFFKNITDILSIPAALFTLTSFQSFKIAFYWIAWSAHLFWRKVSIILWQYSTDWRPNFWLNREQDLVIEKQISEVQSFTYAVIKCRKIYFWMKHLPSWITWVGSKFCKGANSLLLRSYDLENLRKFVFG